MKTPTFNETVDILVKAYLNGTLNHTACAACACGNIIAGSLKAVALNEDNVTFQNKDGIRIGVPYGGYQPHYNTYDKLQALEDVTGYTHDQFKKIEFTFMSNARADDDYFTSLIAVVDLLAEIHNIDLYPKEEAKKLFVKI